MVRVRIPFIPLIVAVIILAACLVGAWYFFGRGSDDNGGDTVDEGHNRSPRAFAGLDRVISPGENVTLDGSLSTDPDGDSLTFKWDLDDSIDSNGDGILDNDADLVGMVVEHIYPWTDVSKTYRVTLNASDGEKWDTDTLLVTIYVGSTEEAPELNMTCSHTSIPPPLPGDPYYAVTVDSVSSRENLLNFSYRLISPGGDVLFEGGLFPLVAAPPNATIRYVDSNPRYQDVSAGDVLIVKDVPPVLEGSSLEIYYKAFEKPVGSVLLMRALVFPRQYLMDFFQKPQM